MGTGADYQPWLKKRDVPSQGSTSNVRGVRIPRPFHLLSGLEATYFFMLERRANVTDIREQFPILDIPGTLNLCSQQNVRHAYKSGYPEPFTIDFLVTELVDGVEITRAASIKPANKATNQRVRARLAIECDWCHDRTIPWTLVDTSKFTSTVLDTLRFIRGWFQSGYVPQPDVEKRFVEIFSQIYRPNNTLLEMLNSVANWSNISQTEAQIIFRYCAWSRSIEIDIERRLDLRGPISLLEA
jgi:hypothetical protein